MKYVVGLSGTHGTGKSTIMNGVEKAGFKVNRAQLSRTAQKALGWESLSVAQASVDNMWALQDAILKAMRARDADIVNTGTLTLVERTPADMWAYTKMWCARLGIDPKTDDRALNYYDNCVALNSNYAKILFIPMIPEVVFVEEPNRADLASRAPVEESIKDYLLNSNVNFDAIRGVSPEARVLETTKAME